jgi:flagellar biosynthetic protein FliQ
MSPQALIDIMHQALWVSLLLAGPTLGLALIVGLFFSVFQAVTSIQEQSLIFVPKILAAVVSLLLLMGWMTRLLIAFTTELFMTIPSVTP